LPVRLDPKRFGPLILMANLTIACGGNSRAGRSSGEIDTMRVIVVDTIGCEFGDSSQVFGMIVDAERLPSGGVAVLDAAACCLRVFDEGGRESIRAGGRGPGPGEFQMPVSLAVLPNGGMAVSDMAASRITIFNRAGAPISEISDFFPLPPVSIAGLDESTLVGASVRFLSGTNGASSSLILCTYHSGPEPETILAEYPLSPDADGRDGQEPDFRFAVDQSGNIYVAERSDSLLLVNGYRSDGREVLALQQHFDRIPFTKDRAQGELHLSVNVINGCATTGTVSSAGPANRITVRDIGVDAVGRIWLEMGDRETPYFRVLSAGGSDLFIALVDTATISSDARFSITPYGMIAYDFDPIDWPKVYVLDVAPRQ
jgi:hypothetical protein